MSLVNDALKRAKQAQQENPPPNPELAFRPVEPLNEGQPGSPLLFFGAFVGLVLVIAAAGFLIWAVTNKRGPDLHVEARPGAEPVPAVVAPQPIVTPPVVTNVQPEIVEPPKPELKLQGIFFSPTRPSAVVNDRTVYVGDRVSGLHVRAITPQAVVLTSATETNVLSLSH
ncbi:MAG TPA: hypothetical protein VFZ59_12160 [Verrucomicrobiae bacterium]|nr:hypothetical protein [Verrucomicrobiae bacterium]